MRKVISTLLFLCLFPLCLFSEEFSDGQLNEKLTKIGKLGNSILKNGSKFVCDTKKIIDSNKPILVAFEGTGKYSKQRDVLYRLLTEYDLMEKYRNNFISLLENKNFREFVSKIDTGDSANFTLLKHLRVHQLYLTSGYELLYFNRRGKDKALKCLLELYDRNPSLETFVTGHSWGAIDAIKLVKELEKRDLKVNKLFTIDPVSKNPIGVLKNLLSKKNSTLLSKINLKTKWINVYQKTDTKTLKVGLQGNSIKSANLNLEALNYHRHFHKGKIQFTIPEVLELAHSTIYFSDEFSQALNYLLRDDFYKNDDDFLKKTQEFIQAKKDKLSEKMDKYNEGRNL